MIELFIEVIQQTLLITGFVITMMMIIEFVNILSHGNLLLRLKSSPVGQVIAGTVLGMIPGCLGTYTAVSLFTHQLLSFGALVAALIATSGDETFVMLALIPREAIIIIAVTGVVGFIAGVLIDRFYKPTFNFYKNDYKFELHGHENSVAIWSKLSIKNFSFTYRRVLALLIFGFFIIAPFTGIIEHNHNVMMPSIENVGNADALHNNDVGHPSHEHHVNWLGITLAICASIGFIICLTCSEHFFTDHIWKHLIKKHFIKIFLWTFLALILIQVLLKYTSFDIWISENLWLVLLAAVLIGIIPESGPHLLFISLYISGAIPLSILIANSIIQDGHGALPLFAESKKSFFIAKGLNIVISLAIGAIGLLIGF
ncbi:MAG: arsenic efflux protein [Bacteroidales bacterium]|nr:arsenic efflux protein [Bacteroidales bacterium]HOY39934.1 putative manganese transporter [Bacteroidales bacterium]